MRPFAGRRLADSFCCACPNCICSTSVDIYRGEETPCATFFCKTWCFQQPLLGSVSRATSLPTGDVIYLEFLVQAATKVKRITKLNQTPKWCSADSQLKKKTPSYSQFHSVCPYVHFFCTCLQVRLYALYIWRLIWSQAWFNVTEILRYVTVVSEVEIRGHGTDC